MKRFFLTTLVCLLTLPLPVRSETVDRIVAVVNNEAITSYQLTREMARRTAEAGADGSAATAVQEGQVLDAMIETALIRQQAAELGVKVAEKELESAIQDVLTQNDLTRPQLEEALQAQGIKFDEYKENLRQQILRFKVIGRQVQSKVDVTGEEIRGYYQSHPQDFSQQPFLRLSRLTFSIPPQATPEQLAAVQAQAAEAVNRLRQGEDFNAVLLQVSAGGNASGGDMGRFEVGHLTEAFEKAVAGKESGEVTDPIQTAAGIHILKIVDRSTATLKPLDEVREQIEKILFEKKTQERFKVWAETLKQEAFIDRRL